MFTHATFIRDKIHDMVRTEIGLWVTLIYMWRLIFLYKICSKTRVRFKHIELKKSIYQNANQLGRVEGASFCFNIYV